jgi:hypothetical protein
MVVKEATMEVLILVLALVTLGVSAQIYGVDSRPSEAERRRS